MSFEKGKSKTGGRKIGIPNVIGRTLRERVKEHVESNFDDFAASIYELAPKERIVVWLKLMEFVLPKATYAQVEVEAVPQVTDGGELSADQVERLIALFNEPRNT